MSCCDKNYDYSILWRPIDINKCRIRNRISMSGMGTFTPTMAEQYETESGLRYYEERAKGGIGLMGRRAPLVPVAAYESLPAGAMPRQTGRMACHAHRRQLLRQRIHISGPSTQTVQQQRVHSCPPRSMRIQLRLFSRPQTLTRQEHPCKPATRFSTPVSC